MKIWRIGFVVVVGFLVFGAAAVAAQQVQEQFRLSVQRANVRDMPSTRGEVIFQVSQDEVLKVIQKEGDWYWVENSTGRRGYISNTVVRLVGPVKAPSRSEPNVPEPLPPILQKPSSDTIRNSDVIAMVKVGLSDSIIIAAIKQSASAEFDVSPAGLIALKTGGVSEAVIQTLIDRSGSFDAASSGVTEKAVPVIENPRKGELAVSQLPPGALRPGFDEWNSRLEQTRVKRGRGMKFALIGIGTTVVGPLIGGSTGSPSFVYLLALGGTGITVYGGWTWYSARQEIEDLDQEGRIKGYLTFVPTDGGVRLAMNFRF